MDVHFFLSERTNFIRYFFEEAVKPFEETIHRIRAEEPPYVPPPWDDSMSDEPAFMSEYNNATAGLDVVGQTCLSILSESLKAFFQAHERKVGLSFREQLGEKEFKQVFRKGFIHGYQTCFERFLHVDWANCPADLKLLEQIVMARNDSQHAGTITQSRATHSRESLKKFPTPFFVNESERSRLSSEHDGWLIEPTVFASKDQLQRAFDEVVKLAVWFECDGCVSDKTASEA